MGKNSDKDVPVVGQVEKPVEKQAKKPEALKTVYTHGKVYKIPVSADVEEFLKKKFPREYK